jgi:hypothetical protein
MSHLTYSLSSLFAKVDLNPLPKTGASTSVIQTVITIVLGIIGAIAVMFIVIGGMRYILSQGDPQAVGKAKGTIIYALVGLLFAILAQAIVGFIVGRF